MYKNYKKTKTQKVQLVVTENTSVKKKYVYLKKLQT